MCGVVRRRFAGKTSVDRARDEAGASCIIEIEEPAYHLPCAEEAGDRRVVDADRSALGVDLDAPEGEGDAAGDRIGFARPIADRVGPVRLRDFEAIGAASVLRSRIYGQQSAERRVGRWGGRRSE